MSVFSIREGDIQEVVNLSKEIPEFINPQGVEEYQKRLQNVPHLILIATKERQNIGFKVGYERDGEFYSWMGGVHPEFRKLGMAKALADAQADWAKRYGYSSITFKTRNQHKAMLVFALKNGFNIIGFKEREHIDVHRILLRKSLKS